MAGFVVDVCIANTVWYCYKKEMGGDQLVKITSAQLEKLMNALGLNTKVELAIACGTKASGVGWYFTKEEIPVFRLKLLALRLDEILQKPTEATREQISAKEFIEQKTKLSWPILIADAKRRLEASKIKNASAMSVNPLLGSIYSPTGSALGNCLNDESSHAQADTQKVLEGIHTATLEALTDEIQRRGWQISLSRRFKDEQK